MKNNLIFLVFIFLLHLKPAMSTDTELTKIVFQALKNLTQESLTDIDFNTILEAIQNVTIAFNNANETGQKVLAALPQVETCIYFFGSCLVISSLMYTLGIPTKCCKKKENKLLPLDELY